jgi:hypothetical protein
MKVILMFLLLLLISCNGQPHYIVQPVGQSVKVDAYTMTRQAISIGDTVIIIRRINNLSDYSTFQILNDFQLRTSWVEYDSMRYGYYGVEYYKAVVIRPYP